MKKKIFALCSIFVFCFQLFAATGSLAGEKDLRVVKTKWFDIIYPQKCELSAELLYTNADRIYDEVADQYGMTPQFRMPLVITPAVECLNAYYNPIPYNHIVLYDTSFLGVEELAVFSDGILSVFRHELTHAVTLNMRNGFWNAIGKTFGDIANIGLGMISTGFLEGATVTSESASGEGRLNDEYAKHPVKQAKIEGEFPGYYDVQGASELSPGGAPYYFNGAFHLWLQQMYGMEKYAKFWYKMVNVQSLGVTNAFKKVYGFKLKTAWKMFEESYEVPNVPSNPVAAGQVDDFFEKNAAEYSRLNDAGALYSSLTSSEKRIVWIDSYGKRVLFVDRENLGNEKIKPKKLFNLYGAYDAKLSKDGNMLAVSCFSDSALEVKAVVQIYNFETKQLFKVKENGLKDAAILSKDGEYYLVASKFETPYNSVKIYKIEFEKNRIRGLSLVSEKTLPLNVMEVNFVDFADGTFAYVQQDELSFSICVCDFDFNLIYKYDAPEERMVIRSLSGDGDNLLFSWAKKGTLPRFGILETDSGKMQLSSADVSGGVFSPVAFGGEVVYVGNFFHQNRLFRFSLDGTMGTALDVPQVIQNNANKGDNGDSPRSSTASRDNGDSPRCSLDSVKFNPLKYFTKGIFIPVSLYSTEYFGCNTSYTNETASSILGATYITANPWTDGTNDLYQLTAGYNLFNSSFGIEFTANQNADTSMLQTTTDVKTEFDQHGWKQSGLTFTLGSRIQIGKISEIKLQNQAKANIGRQDKRDYDVQLMDMYDFTRYPELLGCCAAVNKTVYYALNDVITIGYDNIHKTGPGRYEYAGIYAGFALGYWYDASIEERPVEFSNGFNTAFSFTGYIPRLLPFESEFRYTTNQPTKINLDLLPSTTIYGNTKPVTGDLGVSLFDVETETVLFGYNFQETLPFFTGLFINNLYISYGYAGSLAVLLSYTKTGWQLLNLPYYMNCLTNGNVCYLDSIYLKASVEFTPNIGRLANSGLKMNLYGQLNCGIHCSHSYEMFNFQCGFQSSF